MDSFFSLQLVPVILKELLAMMILVMTMEHVAAEQMLKVTSVTHVRLVTQIFQRAQVTELPEFNC